MTKKQETELNSQDYKNLILLINKTPITGVEAETVSILKYKLSLLITEEPNKDK